MDPEVEETFGETSKSRKITAAVVTLAVSIVFAMAASGVADKLNEKIRKQIVKEDEE